MDVKSAFLYGVLKEEIYMRLPEGYRTARKVAQLHKCIYGLKQSGCEWYAYLSALLREIGFVISHFDPCVFIHKSESTFISVYVDDITIISPSFPFVKEIKQQLNLKFDCKDLSDAKYILGLELTYTETGISISQYGYIEKILLRFGMSDSQPVATPLNRICHYGKRNQIRKSRISVYTKVSSDPICTLLLELDQISPTLLRSYHNLPHYRTKHIYKQQTGYYDT